jgi:hypothetical protein
MGGRLAIRPSTFHQSFTQVFIRIGQRGCHLIKYFLNNIKYWPRRSCGLFNEDDFVFLVSLSLSSRFIFQVESEKNKDKKNKIEQARNEDEIMFGNSI